MSTAWDSKTEEQLQKEITDLVFANRELGRRHNPYDQEIREFTSIENGDLDQLRQSLEEVYPGEVGSLAKDPLRHAKNRAIVVITLASRAAIRGGVLPEIAFSLSDAYIQRVEECRDIPTVFHLFYSAEFRCAQMVRELKEQAGTEPRNTNLHITRCKDYISAHLHDKISVQDIAAELGLNPNYLSELFHSCEHIPLTSFIQREKVHLAKSLLIYSQFTYSEIAAYLSYSSQSHLGKQFKKITGMTLRQYREAYGSKAYTMPKLLP